MVDLSPTDHISFPVQPTWRAYAHMALTTASSSLSSMVISRSPLLLTLIGQQSFSYVDNDRAYSSSIMPLLIFHLQPHPKSFGLSPLPPSFPQTLLRHFSLPPYVPNSVVIPTFTRASFFNWASPRPSSPCQLITQGSDESPARHLPKQRSVYVFVVSQKV